MSLFPGFIKKRIKTSGATINLVIGGEGPPLLMLHGYPQTHAMWHKVAPELARDYTVVCADLRGYGDSSKPKGLPGHANYSKRAVALDMVEVMEDLGFLKYHVVGHDRGGRVAHRMARDHGKRVMTLTVLDISPTLKVFQNVSKPLATAFYHWFFLIQKAPLPERLIQANAAFYLLGRLGRGPTRLKHFDKRAVAEYLRCFKDPRAIHASCEDYRAAATIDLVHDKKTRGKITMPVLALWARHSPVGALFDCLADWREVATDVRGREINCGHFIPEEAPRILLAELRRFLKEVQRLS
ncbi:MAG TPA: alpha/beta hydrolase [Burkholderiales bacterium]|nr:alpha/beta hydrolase [Burkholderiales bacterium]